MICNCLLNNVDCIYDHDIYVNINNEFGCYCSIYEKFSISKFDHNVYNYYIEKYFVVPTLFNANENCKYYKPKN